MRRTFTVLLGLLAVLPGVTGAAGAGEHVRVILDVSRSMRANDPPRLATLATLLLYDLADPNLTLDDSFEVLPFHPTQHWVRPADPPPTGIGTRIVPRPGARAAFVHTLQSLPYEGAWTYFYPGLKAAIDDLEKTPGGSRDVRVVVLVTDGLPEAPTRSVEARHIRDELLPRLDATGIRFYVLAFGPEADRNRGFFTPLVQGRHGSLGEVLVDRDGSRLLPDMAEIFSRSFGYTQDPPRRLPGIRSLDLEGGATPDRVAVAVFSPQGAHPPALRLAHPAGGSLNHPGGVVAARERGASYALTWVLSPSPGSYGFDTDVLAGAAAVLRPTRLQLELRPVPPRTQIGRTMAETPLPLQALVKPAAGARGDVPPVEISFNTLGEKTPEGYAWRSRAGAPAAGSGALTPDGRVYPIQVQFAADQDTKRGFYRGYIEIEARRGEAVVGALRGPTARPVEVYPLVRIQPVPSRGDALAGKSRGPALGRGDEGCTRFRLSLDAGRLPHPDRPRYPLRATLDRTVTFDGALREATVNLDGLPLQVEGAAGTEPGDWFKGRLLNEGELLGEHETCLQVGRPTAGDLAKPLDIPLRFTLQMSPYDELGVVAPFTLKALVAPPGLLERWQAPLGGGVGMLLLVLSLWHLRHRPRLPPDLLVAVGRTGAAGPPPPKPVPPTSLARRLLGLQERRPVDVPGEDRRLGWLVPTADVLFRFQASHGVQVEGPEPEERRFWSHDGVPLEVRRTYRLATGGTSYDLRLEYR